MPTRKKHKAPGHHLREGISIIELWEMFPNESSATRWFEATLWPAERCCGKCGSIATSEVPNRKPMPYWCSDCRSYFSVRTGTAIARSNVPLRKWAIAIYLCLTSLKSVSSMKLHRDIRVTQKTAWFMLQRIREAWAQPTAVKFAGPVEMDETYIGGLEKNKHARDRKHAGTGASGKTTVAGVKDRASNEVRAQVVADAKGPTLRRFVLQRSEAGALIYTDTAKAYATLPNHEAVAHSAGEYVRGMVHTNGMESFWANLKRAHMGTFHKLSPKHLQRYVGEFEAKHNDRDLNTITQMTHALGALIGKNLLYRDLIADNGLASGARPTA